MEMHRPAKQTSGALTHSLPRKERAQSVVELALVLPVFLILVMAIIDFGWALRSYISLTNSAREGARYGILCVDDDDIKARVVDYSSLPITPDDVTVVSNPCKDGSDPATTSVEVRAEYDHKLITPLGGLLSVFGGGSLGSEIHLSSTTKMRQEN